MGRGTSMLVKRKDVESAGASILLQGCWPPMRARNTTICGLVGARYIPNRLRRRRVPTAIHKRESRCRERGLFSVLHNRPSSPPGKEHAIPQYSVPM